VALEVRDMVSSEVQRTLVKSPPELWTELSDPGSLAGHLGELGEIRITHVEPETAIEWEADGATGVVRLESSGWGTKVTLTMTREIPNQRATVEIAEPLPAQEPEAELDAEPAGGPEPVAEPADEPEPVAEPADEPEPVAEPNEPRPAQEPRRRFFARLFARLRSTQIMLATVADTEPLASAQAESTLEPPAIEQEPEPEREAQPEPKEPLGDLASELVTLEAEMTDRTTELLTSVLDRLGAAHHRPFSRG
jgi:hypothetical protein